MMLSITCGLVFITAIHPPLSIHANIASAMRSGTYIPNPECQDVVYQYRLFEPFPTNQDSSNSFPLVVWLHGYGDYEYRHENVGQLAYTELLLGGEDRFRDNHFFLLAVQLPSQQTWCDSESPGRAGPDALDHLWQLVIELQRTKPIDSQRICVVGISGGGSACWELIRRNPDQFAAAAPLACETPSFSDEAFGQTRIWTFVSEHDRGLSIEKIRSGIDQLKRAGASVQLTVIPGYAHNSWGPAFSDYPLRKWLFHQRLGSWRHFFRGDRTNQGWRVLTRVVIPAAVATVLWRQCGSLRRAIR